MGDSAEEYLRLASRMQRTHFARGYSTTMKVRYQSNVSINEQERTNDDTEGTPMRLPMKKRRKNDDSDEEENLTVNHGNTKSATPVMPSVSPPPKEVHNSLYASLTATVEAGNQQTAPKKMTLMEKWFPGSTLKNATIDAALSPPSEYVEMAVGRIKSARERLLSLRAGVEDVLQYTAAESNGDSRSDNVNWNWRELRFALSELTSIDAFRSKKRVRHAVEWLHNSKPQTNVLCSPVQHEWSNYLCQNGPEQGNMPTLSLFVWVDSACTAALFSSVVSRLLRGYKIGVKNPSHKFSSVYKGNAQDMEFDEYEDESGEEVDDFDTSNDEVKGREEDVKETDNAVPMDLYNRLKPVCVSDTDDGIVSLLWFLRYLMPIDFEDANSGVMSHSAGYGVWLYSCLSAVDTPLEPDLDRLVHELFRTCCDQVRTIGEALGVRGDDRGAILRVIPPRGTSEKREYNSIGDVRRDDVLALHAIIIILAKLFRQNQNRLIPL